MLNKKGFVSLYIKDHLKRKKTNRKFCSRISF